MPSNSCSGRFVSSLIASLDLMSGIGPAYRL
jgi:hypothetical protein